LSNLHSGLKEDQHCRASACATIGWVIEPREKDLGEFSVRRVLPSRQVPMVGPWIFFDHMGPASFDAGSGVNVRPHPHINLATVTYLFEGEILHRDSLGSRQPIRPGDINLMVAGRGITHSERERPEVTEQAHRLHGLQLWLALPEADEEIDPAFYHYPEADVPKLDVEGVPVRLMMGSAYGTTSPVTTFAKTLYLEARLQAGQTLAIPDEEERGVYVVSGEVNIDGSHIRAHQMAVLSNKPATTLHAEEDCLIVIIGGEPLGKRHIFWNFVSSRKERIEKAKEDWAEGRFAKVVDDEQEFIPMP
jgi:hypothetical protein